MLHRRGLGRKIIGIHNNASLSHLVEFSGHLLREKLLKEVPISKSINGHNLRTSSLPVIPGKKRKEERWN